DRRERARQIRRRQQRERPQQDERERQPIGDDQPTEILERGHEHQPGKGEERRVMQLNFHDGAHGYTRTSRTPRLRTPASWPKLINEGIILSTLWFFSATGTALAARRRGRADHPVALRLLFLGMTGLGVGRDLDPAGRV